MGQNALYQVAIATDGWMESTQKNQQVTATTVDFAATWLVQLYKKAQAALTAERQKLNKFNPKSKTYSTQVNIWETKYNTINQEWQNLENAWNTPIQSLDTHEQALGNDAQEAAQMISIVTQPGKQTGMLIGQSL